MSALVELKIKYYKIYIKKIYGYKTTKNVKMIIILTYNDF